MSEMNRHLDLDSSKKRDSIEALTDPWRDASHRADAFLRCLGRSPHDEYGWMSLLEGPDIYNEDLETFVERLPVGTTLGTQAPLVKKLSDLEAAQDAFELMAERMRGEGGLYLFISHVGDNYAKYLDLIQGEPNLRLKSVGMSSRMDAEPELIVLQAEHQSAGRFRRRPLPAFLPEAPARACSRREHAGWFRDLARLVLRAEGTMTKNFADPLTGDYALAQAAMTMSWEVTCREVRPRWIAHCRSRGLIVGDGRPVPRHELELFGSGAVLRNPDAPLDEPAHWRDEPDLPGQGIWHHSE